MGAVTGRVVVTGVPAARRSTTVRGDEAGDGTAHRGRYQPAGDQPPRQGRTGGSGRSRRGRDADARTGRKAGASRGRKKNSVVPRWARVCSILGALLMVLSGGGLIAYEALLARYAGAVTQGDLFDAEAGAVPTKEIKGALNILLVGIDPRKPETPPLSDSVMILHVNEAHDEAYLFSMPRDLRVDIPPFPKAGYRGGNDRLNAAMSLGSRVPGQNPSAEQGFQLLARTLTDYTGIKQFDAGVIINFSGFQKIVDAMGGVEMYIERDVTSEHRRPDGTHRTMKPGGGGYLGPQAEYKKGMRHLNGWQALDYVRQRYPENGVPDGDYGRQRHQQQFIKAMAKKALSADVVANPIKLDRVLQAAGKSLTWNGRGNSVVDYAVALSSLRPDSIHMIKLPGGGIMENGKYQGERFEPVVDEFFDNLRQGTLDEFMLNHPELLNREK